jgi:hypothetical protein
VIVRLGTWLPFEQVPEALTFLCAVHLSASTARRLTEGAGALLEEAETIEAERIDREAPPCPPGPPIQQVSVDGSMVPLIGGDWAEARLVAIGTVEEAVNRKGEVRPAARNLSYFARLTTAEEFCQLATIATYRSGTDRAGQVCAIVDGADWLQGFLDRHCPQAVRILDFCHAMGYVADVAAVAYGAGSAEATTWFEEQRETMRLTSAQAVLQTLRALTLSGAAATVRDKAVHYLEQREAQLAYATFREQGFPIGSGVVESGNKLVVQDRLKRSGMRWSRAQVNPMLALRGTAASGQWETGWVTLWERKRTVITQAREEEWRRQQAAKQPSPPPAPSPERLGVLDGPSTMVNGKPTPSHPWRGAIN